MVIHIFNNGIKKHTELPSIAPVIQELPTSALDYVTLSFFKY